MESEKNNADEGTGAAGQGRAVAGRGVVENIGYCGRGGGGGRGS